MKHVVYFFTVFLFMMISTPAIITLKIITLTKTVFSSKKRNWRK